MKPPRASSHQLELLARNPLLAKRFSVVAAQNLVKYPRAARIFALHAIMAFLLALFRPLAYVSLPIIFLRSLAQTSPTARYYIRLLTYASTMATVASCSFFIAATYSLLGRKYDVQNVVARFFYHGASKVLNIRVEVEGEEHLDSRPALLMGNHQSMLDILILGRVFPKQASIVSKDSLRYSPLGPFMTLSGAIFINRGNNVQAVKSLNDAGSLIKKLKLSIWMFPEGTRHLSEEVDMLPLKKGGFHLAINSGIPIIPVVAENYYHMYHKGVFSEGVIKVRVLPPIPTLGLTAADASALATRVRDQMVETLREISRKPPVKIEGKPKSSEKAPATITPPNAEKSSPQSIPEFPGTPNSDLSGLSGLDFGSSSVSLSSSVASLSRAKSDNGAETEEDEGMILVGRPSTTD